MLSVSITFMVKRLCGDLGLNYSDGGCFSCGQCRGYGNGKR